MMSKLLATCAALAVTAVVSLPAQAAPVSDHNASMKSGAIEVSSARRMYHHRSYRHSSGPRYGYYGYGPGYVSDDYYGYGYGGCVWQRQRFWDGYGWRVRRVRVCG